MLRLVAGLIVTFIMGGLVAMPFTASSVAAQDGTASSDASDDDTVCCDATSQYDTLEFATRAACRSKNGVVVENNRCEPKDDDGAVADLKAAARNQDQCKQIIEEYMALAKSTHQGESAKPVMAQIAFNKSRGDSMHYHLGYGPANSYNNDLQIGINLTIAHFEHNPATDEYLEFGDFKIDREDLVISALYPEGGSLIILADWNAELPLEDMQCSSDRFGAYISGKLREGNGTTLVSIVLNQMTYQDGQ